MKKANLYIFFVLALIFSCNFQAQNKYIDSLKKILKQHPNDTVGAKALCNLCNAYNAIPDFRSGIKAGHESVLLSQKTGADKVLANVYSNLATSYLYLGLFDSALWAHNNGLKTREKMGDSLGIARSYASLGGVYLYKNEFDKSLEYSQKALKLGERFKIYQLIADMYVNMGNTYYYLGDRSTTIDYFLKALELTEKHKLEGLGTCLNNIAIIYAEEKQNEKAASYFERTLKIHGENNNEAGVTSVLGNLAGIYANMKQYDKALQYAERSIKLGRELGMKSHLASALANAAETYKEKGEFEKGLVYAIESYSINQEIGSKEGISSGAAGVARLLLKLKRANDAEKYATNGLKIAKEISLLDAIRDNEWALNQVYEQLNKPALALEHYKGYVAARDSLNNSENTREITQKEMNFEFKKEQEKQKAEQEKKEIENSLMQKQQRVIIFSVIAGLLLVIIFSLFLYKRYRLTQKQNLIIEEQNKEIIDSITYAKRLQDAILPTTASIQKILPESFIYYKPKAIVAGDFYWAEKIGDDFFIAAADSTGHGVPGAMVSVVCSNALNRSVKEFHLTDTGKILDKTRELVLETFEKSSENVKDGMDISLLSINLKTKKVYWSGANNSLWYVQDQEIKEVKADKQPIGLSDSPKPFASHLINNAEASTFYLFTDGLADQFGGPKGKKFKYKQFSDLLLSNSHLSMPQQMEMINTAFVSWKGTLEQVDDICVIGIKL